MKSISFGLGLGLSTGTSVSTSQETLFYNGFVMMYNGTPILFTNS